MANTDKPYRRVGSNSWQELLDQVNDKLQDPPSGCDPIDPIETPDEPHRWAKSDVREVHDTLNEMPGDCFEFEDIPDLWKVSIIDDIEGQLENAWCECEECIYPCENARSDLEEIDLFSVSTGSGACTTCGRTQEDNDRCRSIFADLYIPPIIDYFAARDIFNDSFLEACDLQEEIEDLEDEIESLEDEIEQLEEQKNEACADEDQVALCQTLTQKLEEKEGELAEKQEELEEKQEDLAEAESDRDEAATTMVSSAADAWSAALSAEDHCAAGLVLRSVTPGPTPTNMECGATATGVGPSCDGAWDRNVLRCTVTWSLQQRLTYYIAFCSGTVIGPFGGKWRTINGGHYGIDGGVVLTSWGPSGGDCQTPIHSATCFSNDCSGACGEGESPCVPGSAATMDYRIVRNYPNEFDPINCDNDPCGQDDEDGGGEEGGEDGGGEEPA